MGQGVQIWEDAGNLILDVGTYVGRVLGSTTTTAGVSGSVTGVSGFDDGVGGFCVVPIGALWSGVAAPTVTISGTTISWTAASTAVKIIYGVY